MSPKLLKAAKALADAVRDQKEYVRIFEECPKDEIELALEEFDRQWKIEVKNNKSSEQE